MNLILPAGSTPQEAMLWLRQLIRDFGLGFHLDSAPEDYVFPDGTPVFTRAQCATLTESLERLFQILGEGWPYEIGADIASDLLCGSLNWKPPLIYHDPACQQELLQSGAREQLIAWLCWNDPNGIYTDQASLAEGRPLLTLDQAREMMHDQMERDASG